MAFRSRHCFSGMVTKYHGAGPFQNQTLPLNSMFIGTVYQMPNSVYSAYSCSASRSIAPNAVEIDPDDARIFERLRPGALVRERWFFLFLAWFFRPAGRKNHTKQ